MIPRLERFVLQLLEADAIHRDGTRIKTVAWSVLFEHLDREIAELKTAIADKSDSDVRSELGDVLGIVVHAIAKAGFSVGQVEVSELHKLAERFTLPDGSRPIVPWTAPAAGRANSLNSDHDEARALHRIVRAMHDGECPKCHAVHPSQEMRVWVERRTRPPLYDRDWICPSCNFTITQPESEAVFQIFAPFMERNLAIFEQWRSQRAAGNAASASPA